jgi:hypothetical protein
VTITVKRTGGFAGVNEVLGPVDANDEIEGQVATIGFFELPDRLPGGEDIDDAFQYAITVEDGYRSKTVSFTDTPDDTHRGVQQLIGLVEATGAEWKDQRGAPTT